MYNTDNMSFLDLYLSLIDSVNQNISENVSGEDRLQIVDDIIVGLKERKLIGTN